ncbi:MAG: flagellar hook-length control protein FliK [Planctomycetes bacterium]|nr:flagellar hook-length control protein FliK [Planctomycetota bacterium]
MAPLNIDSILASANSTDTSSTVGAQAGGAADAKRGGKGDSLFSAQLVQAVQQQPPRGADKASSSSRGKAGKADGPSRGDKDSRHGDSADSSATGAQTAAAAAANNTAPTSNGDTTAAASALVAALDTKNTDTSNSGDASTTDGGKDAKGGKSDAAARALTGALAKATTLSATTSKATPSDAASTVAGTSDAGDKAKQADTSDAGAATKARAEQAIVAGAAHHGEQHDQRHTATVTSTNGEQQPQDAAPTATGGAVSVAPTNEPKPTSATVDAKTGADHQANANQPASVATPNTAPAVTANIGVSAVVATVATIDAPKAGAKAHAKKDNDEPAAATLDSLSGALGLNGTTAAQRLITPNSSASGEASGAETTTTVDRSRFVQRVAGAFRAAEQSGGPVKLRLSPPELGALNLEIQVQQGQIHAHIEVETPQAQSLLLDNIAALRDRLEQQDIKVAQFDVGLMGNNNNNNGGNTPTPDRSWQQSGDGAPRNTFVAPTTSVGDVAAPTAGPATTPLNFTSGVNVLV